MRPDLLDILQHSLGVDQYGRGPRYRNHFCAGPDDESKCRELVALGYMRESRYYPGTNRPLSLIPDILFLVTREGAAAVLRESPSPPKRTRSQQRYEAYLKVADLYEGFGDYLRHGAKHATH